MKSNYSLILGPKNDPHVNYIRDALLYKNQKVICIDTAKYPEQWQLSWLPRSSHGAILQNDLMVEFSQIRSAYWRLVSASTRQSKNPIINRDCASMLCTLLSVPHIHWVNGKEAIDMHKVKPMQLHYAKLLGATVPRSYMGNDANQAMDFLKSIKHAIFKPIHGGAKTQSIDHQQRQIRHLRDSLAICPVTLQEYIQGTNVRTYVIGHCVFSIEISSTRVDFRDDHNARAIPLPTPPDVAHLARRIMRYFKMQWTAIDWRKNLDGQYYFLEANPSPMFIDLQMSTGLPIGERLLELLIQPSNK